jgi:MFS transporter
LGAAAKTVVNPCWRTWSISDARYHAPYVVIAQHITGTDDHGVRSLIQGRGRGALSPIRLRARADGEPRACGTVLKSRPFPLMHTGQRQAPLATPVCGLLSDRIGRKPLLLASCAALAAVPPLFIVVLANPSFELIVIAQLLVALIIALYIGPAPAAIAELFATTTRTTSLSTANGIAVAIFGGFSPFIATWLISTTGSAIAPIFYVIASAAISALAILSLRESAHHELR